MSDVPEPNIRQITFTLTNTVGCSHSLMMQMVKLC